MGWPERLGDHQARCVVNVDIERATEITVALARLGLVALDDEDDSIMLTADGYKTVVMLSMLLDREQQQELAREIAAERQLPEVTS